jgi:hypothetical protein
MGTLVINPERIPQGGLETVYIALQQDGPFGIQGKDMEILTNFIYDRLTNPSSSESTTPTPEPLPVASGPVNK